MMLDPVSQRLSNESNLTVSSLGTPDGTTPHNLESQFLRQPLYNSNQGTPMSEGIAARDAATINSFESAGMMRPASQASQASYASNGSEKRTRKKKAGTPAQIHTPASLNYHGVNIYQASNQGNLPLVVLLWSMASNKKVNLMSVDFQGNNPMHYACLADNSEVFF